MDLKTSQNSADLVAVSPAGSPGGMKLAVGFDWADAVAIYRLRHGAPLAHPSMVDLPTGYFALDVGFLADGTIGVGMERFGPKPEPEIDLVHPDGHSTQARVPDGFGVVGDGNEVPRRRLIARSSSPKRVATRPLPAAFKLPAGSRWVVNGADGGPDRMTLGRSARYACRSTRGY